MARTKRKETAAKPGKQTAFPVSVASAIRKYPVLALVVLCLALGVAWMIRTSPVPFSDYRDYYELAGNLLDEGQFGYPLPTARRLPGYPAFLALAMLVSRSFAWLGVLNLLLTAALVPVVYSLTFAFSGKRRAALTAAALCASNPTFVFFSPIVASEHLFTLLLFSSFLPLFWSRLRPWPWLGAALSGLLLGLAVTTRGEGLFYIPVLLFVLWFSNERERRTRVAPAAVLVAVCALALAPWLVRNHIVMGPGSGLSTAGGVNFYYGHNSNQVYGYRDLRDSPLDVDDEVERQNRGYRLGLRYLREGPIRLFGDAAVGTSELLWRSGSYAVRAGLVEDYEDPTITVKIRRRFPTGTVPLVTWYYRALLLLTAVGVCFYRGMGRRLAVVVYGVVIMNWACYAVVFWSKPRFRYTSEAAMCVAAAFTLCSLWGVIAPRIHKRRSGAL